jgi:hypothetical protein
MRVTHKILLVSVAALAAMAMAASTASGQSLEITNEANGTHCPAVSISGTDVDGGCLAHWVWESEAHWFKHVFGIESQITECLGENHARVSEDGLGYVTEMTMTDPPGKTCTRQPCKNGSGEMIPWAASFAEAGGATETGTITTCIEPLGGGTDEICESESPINEIAGTHGWEIGNAGVEVTSHGAAGTRCEGRWHIGWGEKTGTHDGTSEVSVVLNHLN